MDLRTLVASDGLDAELAALVVVLAEHGVPLVVASLDRVSAEEARHAFVDYIRLAQPARDTILGGVVLAGSLEDVLRVLGGSSEISDDTRDLGVVLVIRDGRVSVAHYVRPVERDAAGHLQHRPPGILAARDPSSGTLDQFYWAFTEELATRAGMDRDEFDAQHRAQTAALTSSTPAGRN